jgi:SAM-dependent methyltransferase
MPQRAPHFPQEFAPMSATAVVATMIHRRGQVDAQVSDAMHPRDGMLNDNITHYLSCGRDALLNIALAQASAKVGVPTRILDFACGFGRVARHLRAAYPDAEITFSDAMPDASAFCAESFRGIDRPVSKDLAGYAPGGPFDLIWVGSLFTHLTEAASARLLDRLYGLLAKGGLLVFTSHGRELRRRRALGKWPYNISASQFDDMIAQADASGYGFVGYDSDREYGISLAELAWWSRALDRLAGSELVLVRERGWDRHQDVLAIQRLP